MDSRKQLLVVIYQTANDIKRQAEAKKQKQKFKPKFRRIEIPWVCVNFISLVNNNVEVKDDVETPKD